MNIKSGVAKTAQQIAQQAAKQVVQEPFEMAKSAAKQVGAVEAVKSTSPQYQAPQVPRATEAEIRNLHEKDKSVSTSRYQSLQKEIQAIAIQKKERERQAKELEETQKMMKKDASRPLVEPVTKTSRNPLKGMAKKLSDLGKRAEIRMPPSG
ncbi:hypothetical protein A2V56_03630 [Candidatus Woesebacteria bacterium RBG_19FT_COMBO_42_9]|uniref:Uncharacterized protein n=1 Tax=Candidatus Woesebacteria bacterium RBG_16_42_24 TaxID=1802485 RepID=A0A1F7XJX7_9BACT|nr:MAG: hypothetical protein A2V97_01620 [Candidatus Woesebacteria bacterium RBG_16_42_24]OGM16837.1 MAG: hypothetical protein A2V56_03630 [Candidatus Woesebacteria bacterium RBG_19FT_COMBO_42_9]OGM67607.1 MAG: hypothetical protein A2985_00380 [Candidatus Woesebacteria bacterium RIFCSPLOWO2_01_FULL_43_11]